MIERFLGYTRLLNRILNIVMDFGYVNLSFYRNLDLIIFLECVKVSFWVGVRFLVFCLDYFYSFVLSLFCLWFLGFFVIWFDFLVFIRIVGFFVSMVIVDKCFGFWFLVFFFSVLF